MKKEREKIILILIISLLVVVVLSLIVTQTLFGEATKIRSKLLPAYQIQCSDSDDGIDLEEKGTTKGLMLDRSGKKKPTAKMDYCKNGKLIEYYCGRGLIKSTIKSCPEGKVCEEGKCIGEEIVIGWQFHDDNIPYLSEMIDLAPQYNVNHVELSHNMVWHTEQILGDTQKQQDINNLINQAHQNGIELFIWTHEISQLPDEFFIEGKTDLDNPQLWEWLKSKYRQLFQAIPDVDGIVLTFSETSIPIYNDDLVITEMSKPERVTVLLNTIYEVCEEYDKKLWARTWGEHDELEWISEGIMNANENIWVENKNVECDFCTYANHHFMIGAYGERPQIIEFDLNGQYLGRSWIPSAKPDYLKYRIDYAREKGMAGYVGRVGTFRQDWEGSFGTLTIPNTHTFNTPNEINMYAFSEIIKNPDLSAGDIWMEWAKEKYGEEAAPNIISAYTTTFDIVSQLYFIQTGTQDLTNNVNTNTHSAIALWGIFDDPDKPEGGFWQKIHNDPIFVAVLNGGNLEQEINQAFDPLIETTENSITNIELVKYDLTQEQYSYLKEYLERELVTIHAFKRIKKALVAYAMAKIHQSVQYKELLDSYIKELFDVADTIEQKFGPENPLMSPDDIRTFASGFYTHPVCGNEMCEIGESGEECPDDCIKPYYNFVDKYKQKYGKIISEQELNNQINNMQIDSTVLTQSELRNLIKQGLNIDFLPTDISQEGFKVKVTSEIDSLNYVEKHLLFTTPDIGTFNAILLMPKGYSNPRPAILGLHGHGDSALIFKNNYFATQLVKEGFVVLMPSFRAMDCVGPEAQLSKTMLLNGFSLMGLRVYESQLLIEYLKSLSTVDSSRINLLTHSGGSVVANLLKKLNKDVKAVIYDYESTFMLGCDPLAIHCETIPLFAPYYEQINQQTLALKLDYGYEDEGDYQQILSFFSNVEGQIAYNENCQGPYIIEGPPNFIPDVTHEGDLIISGTETLIIENENYLQRGNIYINDQAKLIIRNSQLAITRGDVPTIHTYIFVSQDASLDIENSLIFPSPLEEDSGLLCIMNKGDTNIIDSPTSIHYFDMSEGATLTMENSAMVFTIGGLLQISGGDIELIDSTLGALALTVPANANMDISGLNSGVYLDSWDVHDIIPEADYNLVLEKTCILKDDFTGELKHGPYERGWLFFLNPTAHVNIANSELRKVFIDLINEDVEFENLKVGVPSSLEYQDIKLEDITVMGQWPFWIEDSDVTITNSNYLFLQPTGQSTISLVNSHIVEFIPRDFFGTIIFENGQWTTAGEILGGVPYHSMENNFTIKGSLQISSEVKAMLQWKDAQVTREYDVIVNDENDNAIEGALIKINGQTFISDNDGKAKFELLFDEFNYIEPQGLEIMVGENLFAIKEIDFFTKTPIIIGGTEETEETIEEEIDGCSLDATLKCNSYQINNDNFVFTIENTGSPLAINQINLYFMTVGSEGPDCPAVSNLNIQLNQGEEIELTLPCSILNNYVGQTVEMWIQIIGEDQTGEKVIDGSIIGVVE